MPKISVIVPVYGVEKYIERCARSLFEQTLDDIEIIFIDDCTPDKSIEILKLVLDNYPNRKPQTRIVQMPTNSGLPAVRGHGLQLATGEYVIHCDSDDWVDAELYERMYIAAVRSDSDIAMCDEICEYSNGSVIPNHIVFPNNPKNIIQNVCSQCIGMFVHNKLVKRALYVDNKIEPYEKINVWEDNGLMYRVFYYAKSLVQVKGVFYHYNRTNLTSITRSNYKGAYEMIECAQRLSNFFEEKPDATLYRETILNLKYIAKLALITDSFKELKVFHSTFPEADVIVNKIDVNSFSRNGKIRFWMVRHHLAPLFVILYKILCLIKK